MPINEGYKLKLSLIIDISSAVIAISRVGGREVEAIGAGGVEGRSEVSG
jgi:hypothetical protein